MKQVSSAVKQMDTVVQQNASLLDLVSRLRLDDTERSFSSTSPAVLQPQPQLVDTTPRPIRVRPRRDKATPYLASSNSAGKQSWTEH